MAPVFSSVPQALHPSVPKAFPENPVDIQVDQLGPVRRRLTFTIAARSVGAALQTSALKIAAKVRVPGFRPGKAPASLIEKMHGTEVRRSALDKLLQDHVFAALTASGTKAVSRPEIENLSDLKRDTDMTVTFTVEVLPELSLSGYDGAAIEAVEVVVDATDLAQALEQKCRDRAEMVPVETGAEPGDEITVDYVLTPKGAAGAGDAMRAESTSFTVGDGKVPAQVDEAVRGGKPGDRIEKTVDLTDADPLYEADRPQLALDVTVHDVQRLTVPTLDDALAVDVGLADLAALTASVQADLQAQALEKTRELRRKAAVDHLLAVNQVEVPPTLVESMVDDQINRMFGNLTPQQMRSLQGALGGFRTNMAKDTEKVLQRSMALESVADAVAVEVSEAEVDAELERLIAVQPTRRELIRKQFSHKDRRGELQRRMRNDKAMDHLVNVAKLTTTGTRPLRDAKVEPDEGQGGHVHGPDCGHGHDSHARAL